MGGKFVITKRRNGELMFTLRAANGQTILTSEGYTRKDGLSAGIESVRRNAKKDSNYERKTSKRGEPFFVLKAGNGQVIGVSEMYSSIQQMENGIKSVRANGPTTVISDLTK